MKRIGLAAAALGAVLAAGSGEARTVTIKLGTLSPEGSPWHEMLVRMNRRFEAISGGDVRLNIYPSGVLGDEPDLIKKLRIGQIQAVGVSTAGLSLLDDGILSLHLPLMFDSDDELDWVRDRLTPKFEAALEAKGFVLLAWTDAGWIRFFTKKRAETPDDVRRLKLFVWAGDSHGAELYTTAKFKPVPLAATDILPALQTGLIEAFDTVPLAALINQWFPLAPYMIDMPWAPLMGAVVVSQRVWMSVPADKREAMRRAAVDSAREMRDKIRALDAEAVPAMRKRGLTVVQLDRAARKRWQEEVEAFWPAMRGKMGPAAFYDEVLQLRAQYRAKGAKAAGR